jgi:hypothetical protein
MFIKIKIAEIFVEIAKRDWLDCWSTKNFRKDILTIARSGSQQTEIVFYSKLLFYINC